MQTRRQLSGLAACLAIVTLATAAMAEDAPASPTVIYAKDHAPATPKLDELPLKESVSQYGITWTFEAPARVGQFVNGDHYVVGPVTVKGIDPKPLVGDEVPESERDKGEKVGTLLRNGSMLNPPAKHAAAMDSGTRNFFQPALAAKLPVQMKAKDSLVSSISMKAGEKPKFAYHGSNQGRVQHDNSGTRVVAVLTCVAEPLPADAFRPAYSDREGKIYLARNLRRDQLPTVPKTGAAPDPVQFAEVFQRCWFNPAFFGFEQPMENMPQYGQWVGQAVSNAGLLLCMDFNPEQKERLLLNFTQVGIDYWGLVKSGHPGWEGWGGHNSGRKFPIVFAGWILGDEAMASPTKGFPKCEFGEDNQTRYGECWTGAKVVFAGHSGISSATGKPPRDKWGPYEHLHPTLWDQPGQKNAQSEAYRRSNTSCCWVGEALAMRLMKLEKQWNHDAFFDYVDRWMTENDKEHRAEIAKKTGDKNLVNEEKKWCHHGWTGDPWVREAWDKYRTMPGMPATDGWKTLKANPDGQVLPAVQGPGSPKETGTKNEDK
jgi:hypothetical protein